MEAVVQPVIIDWIDSVADSGWVDMDEEMQLAHAQSVGYLLETTEDSYILCRTYSKEADIVEGRYSIPRAVVIRMRSVTEALEPKDLP